MDAVPASEPAKSVDTLILFLLPKVIDDRTQWASFREDSHYITFAEQQARAFLEGLPERYRGTEIDGKLFPEKRSGVFTYVDSPHRIDMDFHQGVRLQLPASARETGYVSIPGFTLLFEAHDREGTAAILHRAIQEFYIEKDPEKGLLGVRRGDRKELKQEGKEVLERYLPRGTEVQARYVHPHGLAVVHAERVVL